MAIKKVTIVCATSLEAAQLAIEYEDIGRETRRDGRFLTLLTR